MNQAIQILEEMIDNLDIIYVDSSEDGEIRRTYNAMKGILKEAKKRISSLPSVETKITSLKRYDFETYYDSPCMEEAEEGEFVRYESLVDLLNN